MLSGLILKFGRTPSAPPEKLELTPITVFVGPNNSGKSMVLSEIHQFCTQGYQNSNSHIIERVGFTAFDHQSARLTVDTMRLAPTFGESIPLNHIVIGTRGYRTHVEEKTFLSALEDPHSHHYLYAQWYLNHNILMLNGSTRISLVGMQDAGDLQEVPRTSFQVLFQDDAKRLSLRQTTHEAFGLHLVVDPTRLGHLRLRLSSVAPSSNKQERGIDAESVAFHRDALPIEQTSDGVKAFTGIMTEVIAGDPKIILVDEPEAFLHPALAFKLGKEIARSTSGSDKRLFVSTHSPQFVMGCIQSGAPINIVRLTYRSGVATARILASNDLVRLMRNPLLRSTGLISGLFYEFVIVTESDADRAFYQEINERLLASRPEKGIPNCLFLNAQNKQTVQQLIKPLRELGIPAAAIVDIDVVKDGGATWTELLNGGHVPVALHQSLALLRSGVKSLFETSGKNMKRDGGVAVLSDPDKEAANSLFDQLADYGIFAVRGGELECWLKHLGAAGHGPPWLIDIFEKMGEDPSAADYVSPSSGDVWDFIAAIRAWFTNSGRKGIPS